MSSPMMEQEGEVSFFPFIPKKTMEVPSEMPTAWEARTQTGSGKHLLPPGPKERALLAAPSSACQTQKPNKNKRINESNPDCPEPGCKETHSSCSSGRSNSLHRSKKEEEKLFKSQETKSPRPSFKEGKLLDCSLEGPEEKASKGSP